MNKKRPASPPPSSSSTHTHTPSSPPAPYKQDIKKQKQVDTRATFTPPLFDVGDEAATSYLEENGLVVFRDVIDDASNKKAVDLLWQWLEGLGTGIARGDVKTWDNKYWPEMFVNGIFDRYASL